VAAVGFALAVVSAVMLARFGEADHPDSRGESTANTPRIPSQERRPAQQDGPQAAPGGAAR
jgi:hypothetical protein